MLKALLAIDKITDFGGSFGKFRSKTFCSKLINYFKGLHNFSSQSLCCNNHLCVLMFTQHWNTLIPQPCNSNLSLIPHQVQYEIIVNGIYFHPTLRPVQCHE